MFKYYLSIVVVLVGFLSSSCKRDGTFNEIKAILDSQVDFVSFNNCVKQDSQIVDLSDLMAKYSYKYVVYLQDGCKPCYPKFIEWHKKLADMAIPDDFSVLFVIQGHSYESFMKQVKMLEDIDNDYCVIMDPNYEFIDANSKIPRWIIDASILIDSDNKIKIVGAPWLNNDMEELFLKTIKARQKR